METRVVESKKDSSPLTSATKSSKKKSYECFTCHKIILGWKELMYHRRTKHEPPEEPLTNDEIYDRFCK